MHTSSRTSKAHALFPQTAIGVIQTQLSKLRHFQCSRGESGGVSRKGEHAHHAHISPALCHGQHLKWLPRTSLQAWDPPCRGLSPHQPVTISGPGSSSTLLGSHMLLCTAESTYIFLAADTKFLQSNGKVTFVKIYMGVSSTTTSTMVTFGPEGLKKINPLKTHFSRSGYPGEFCQFGHLFLKHKWTFSPVSFLSHPKLWILTALYHGNDSRGNDIHWKKKFVEFTWFNFVYRSHMDQLS